MRYNARYATETVQAWKRRSEARKKAGANPSTAVTNPGKDNEGIYDIVENELVYTAKGQDAGSHSFGGPSDGSGFAAVLSSLNALPVPTYDEFQSKTAPPGLLNLHGAVRGEFDHANQQSPQTAFSALCGFSKRYVLCVTYGLTCMGNAQDSFAFADHKKRQRQLACNMGGLVTLKSDQDNVMVGDVLVADLPVGAMGTCCDHDHTKTTPRLLGNERFTSEDKQTLVLRTEAEALKAMCDDMNPAVRTQYLAVNSNAGQRSLHAMAPWAIGKCTAGCAKKGEYVDCRMSVNDSLRVVRVRT